MLTHEAFYTGNILRHSDVFKIVVRVSGHEQYTGTTEYLYYYLRYVFFLP
jgi:hypothetical protein